MQAYRLIVGNVVAIMMAEDDEAIMERCFGKLDTVRIDQAEKRAYPEGDAYVVIRGGIWRLGEEVDEQVTAIEVWTNEVKFVPPEGSVQ
jgi:folate-dependent tRNA-U54 methylase TrmFO/GidA